MKVKDLKNSRRDFDGKKLIPLILLAATMGACSVTSLQCGTDGDSSFVNLNTAPKVLSQNARNMAELCSFAYDEQEV